MSTNGNPAYAKAGDVVTVTLNTSEPINVPSVTCSGIVFTVAGGNGGTVYTATHTVASGDFNGQLDCVVGFSDFAGNNGTGSLKSTGQCNVTIGQFTECHL